MDAEFEWDWEKYILNLKKHGISLEEAETVFDDPLSLVVHDESHSEEEDRYLIIGESCKGKLLVISHVYRRDKIRIINARFASLKEKKNYEKK
ncbi:MAG: BrnT family toxin [Deltaproteobacteria bacterium]|nr:BrnT family toxin [Deltaproteobacteria bacterium]